MIQAALFAVALLFAPAQAMRVEVVNMIPASLSFEKNQDSEPHLAVNPANPNQIAASAFTPDPLGGPNAPIFVSNDGGKTWSMNSILPSFVETADVTLAFSANRLYAGVLQREENPDPKQRMFPMVVLRTDDFLKPTAMTTIFTTEGPDQPFISAEQLDGKDRIFVGGNDILNGPRTARVFRSVDSAGNSVHVNEIVPEAGDPDPQDGPQVRTAVSADGKIVYGVFYRWKSFDDSTGAIKADVVLVKDDFGANPFNLLTIDNGTAIGRIVKTDVPLLFVGGHGVMGQERVGGDLAITVDPHKADTVYLAYSDFDRTAHVTRLHLIRSTDGGKSFGPDLEPPLDGAKNPALAMNSDGTLGFLYQRFVSGAKPVWTTVLELADQAGAFSKNTLATAPASVPKADGLPYLGDYLHLVSVGRDFYGIFSFANTPDPSHFPKGVSYARKRDAVKKVLLGPDGKKVDDSIDPFFVHVTPAATN